MIDMVSLPRYLQAQHRMGCEYILSYTASQTWDFTTYLAYAELRLENNNRKIASAEYRLRGGGGLALMKWQSTKTKMDPVIDKLLTGY